MFYNTRADTNDKVERKNREAGWVPAPPLETD